MLLLELVIGTGNFSMEMNIGYLNKHALFDKHGDKHGFLDKHGVDMGYLVITEINIRNSGGR